jgi:hypothetical protein
MKIKASVPACLNLLSAIILVVGLISAGVIYQRAGKAPYGALGYEIEGGTLYPVMPEDSKQYQREMELYGGKANVLAESLRLWVGSLFQGKSLAFIIAGASIIISFGFFYAAGKYSPDSKSRRQNTRIGPG